MGLNERSGPNLPLPNFSLRVTTTQTSGKKQTASGLGKFGFSQIFPIKDFARSKSNK